MWRRVIIWVLAISILLIIGCDSGGCGPSIPFAAITGDNSGSAIAFYQTWRMSDAGSLVEFYVQKISPQGDFLWGERGILIDSGDAALYWTGDLYAVSDGSGGAIVIWRKPLPEPPYSQPHIAKIDSGGNVAWERDISGVDRLIPDGSGGVIIAYIDGNGNMSVLKVDAEGNLPWGEGGVPLDLDGYDAICSDNSGGIIVVEETATLRGGYYIACAQRVDSGGNILWQMGGVPVCVSWPAVGPQIVGDGSGGAIIVYEQYIYGGDGSQAYFDMDIYAQRIDAEGKVLWGPDGVPVCVEPLPQYGPGIVDDGAGGAIVFFVTHLPIGDYHYPAIHALRIDADGHKLWPEDVQVWEGTYISAISDGSGGAINVWYSDNEGEARVQRLDAAGRKLWGPDGTTLTLRDVYLSQIGPDGCGGVLISLVAYEITRDIVSCEYVDYEVSEVSYYVQRIDAEGNVVWGDEGILLNP